MGSAVLSTVELFLFHPRGFVSKPSKVSLRTFPEADGGFFAFDDALSQEGPGVFDLGGIL